MRRHAPLLIFGVWLMAVGGYASEAESLAIDPGQHYTESECQQCHRTHDPQLFEAWENSGHAAEGCLACHETRHRNTSDKARRVTTCAGCHSGAESHSYANSKHGIIERLSRMKQNTALPLGPTNYRVPGCAYCHQLGGEHDTRRLHLSRASGNDRYRDTVCIGCHSPRFEIRYWQSGMRMIEVGGKKLREAEAAIAAQQKAGVDTARALEMLQAMREVRFVNLVLGVGHQSPDYQWWLGHPAMDGDLIRIKDVLSREAATD